MIKLLPILLLALCANSFAQKKFEAEGVTNITKITILNPGVSYEQRIAKFQTLYLQAFMNGSVSKSGFGGSEFYFDPALTLQYRLYYNAKSRMNRGRKTSLNNLNYIGAVWQTFFSTIPIENTYYTPEKRRAVNSAAVVWGFQRNYSKRFSLDLNIGPGILFAKTTYNNGLSKATINQSQFTLYGQLNIGFWLNSRNKETD